MSEMAVGLASAVAPPCLATDVFALRRVSFSLQLWGPIEVSGSCPCCLFGSSSRVPWNGSSEAMFFLTLFAEERAAQRCAPVDREARFSLFIVNFLFFSADIPSLQMKKKGNDCGEC